MLIRLSETLTNGNRSKRVQVAKVGTFEHDVYGKFSITLQDLNDMKGNLEINARRQMMDGKPVAPFDYKHEEDSIAAGWITSLAVGKDSKNIDSLFAEVEWTPNGAGKIRDKEFKFVSPSIRRNYKDSETGERHNVVLKGATLTNIPFLRDMEAIYLLSESKQNAFRSLKLSGISPGNQKLQDGGKMTIEEIMAALALLPPEQKKQVFEALAKQFESEMMGEKDKAVEGMGTAVAAQELSEEKVKKLELKLSEIKKEKGSGDSALADKLELSESKVEELDGRVSSLTKTLADQALKGEFNVMLSEGKVCEAQRVAFMKNDVAEFAKNAQPIKLDESGANDQDDTTKDAETEVNKLAEAKMKDDKTLSYGTAVSMVLSENSKLSQAIN